MLSIIVSWIFIIFVACTIGSALISLVLGGKVPSNLNGIDVSFVAGLLFATVYSEFFSLFSNVGFLAFILLFVFACLIAVYNIKKKHTFFHYVYKHGLAKKRIVLIVISFLAVLLWTSLIPQHYDTYLYHAQAIHWNEEYGAVKGLGNLHFRLAYNSAFISLQSLFSFKWLVGTSMHSLNGLITFAILGYIVVTSFNKKLQISDIMKISIILYVGYDSFQASSPNTDTFALYLIFYVCVKWMEFAERKSRDYDEYGWLCVFLIYAATLKLSVASFVLLAVYPCILIVKNKRIRHLVKYIGICIFIFVPFVIRNFIISGYLVYPIKASGVFDVDWKMLEMVLESDSAEIIAWGRGNKDVSRNSEHIWQWFGDWFHSINILWKVIFILMVISVIYLIVRFVRTNKKERASYNFLTLVVFLGIIFWMETAPLPRYGAVYMIILISIALGDLLIRHGTFLTERIYSGTVLTGLLLYFVIFFGYSYIYRTGMPSLLRQADYQNRETRIISVNDIDWAVPVQGDQTGYEPFPSLLGDIFDNVEMRSDNLKDGFRIIKGERE